MKPQTTDLQRFDKDCTNESAKQTAESSAVPPDEIARRMGEYRRIGYEKRAPAIIVYQAPCHFCPWPGCGYKIAGIDFELDKLGDPQLVERLRAAWWQGPGLVGRCPQCGQYVLFGMAEKKAVSDPAAFESALLPEWWARVAHIVPKPAS
jgi:hypothetical protein